METSNNGQLQPTVIRNSRGLSIAGTRITLYDIMDYVTEHWEPERIRAWFKLTDRQINDVMRYIHEHREDVEKEYQEVLAYAEEIRQYHEERNRARLAAIAAMPPKPGQEAIRAKLAEAKKRLGME